MSSDTPTQPRSNVLRCHKCGVPFTVQGWRLRCPACVTALAKAMHASLPGE